MRIKNIHQNIDFDEITFGKEYVVLTVDFFRKSNITKFRILSDEGFVIYVDETEFELTQNSIPAGYSFVSKNKVSNHLLPIEWYDYDLKSKYSFWEDFYDSKVDAYIVFVEVLNRLEIEVPKSYLEVIRRKS